MRWMKEGGWRLRDKPMARKPPKNPWPLKKRLPKMTWKPEMLNNSGKPYMQKKHGHLPWEGWPRHQPKWVGQCTSGACSEELDTHTEVPKVARGGDQKTGTGMREEWYRKQWGTCDTDQARPVHQKEVEVSHSTHLSPSSITTHYTEKVLICLKVIMCLAERERDWLLIPVVPMSKWAKTQTVYYYFLIWG